MKFISTLIALSALIVVSVRGQATSVGAPAAGTNIRLGKKFTVQIDRPNSIEGGTEVGLAIALAACPGGTCPDPSGQLGYVLYAGQFSPTTHPMAQIYENFSVTAPSADAGLTTGPAQLAVVRLWLAGAGPAPDVETHTVALNMVN
uniref:Uncharacterized protein n=1 Tax=Mycena chlorophos TaxID=658473 RepID=A0ABQ0LDW5_MYCCL|nr:predicted protein [Mycena chlorophos]